VKDGEAGVDVSIRSDEDMPEDEASLTPAQTVALLMANAAFQELQPGEIALPPGVDLSEDDGDLKEPMA
jgi:hypothetical protein